MRWVPENATDKLHVIREMVLSAMEKIIKEKDTSSKESSIIDMIEEEEGFFAFMKPNEIATSQKNEFQLNELELVRYLADDDTSLRSLHKHSKIRSLFYKYNAAIPFSAPVERLFSFAGLVLSPRRSNLKDNSDDSDISSSDSTDDSTPSRNGSDQNRDLEQFKTILWENPADENLLRPAIADEIATRWKTYLSQGIDKEEKTKLIEKWRVPLNCRNLQAPQLNPEVQAMLSITDQKKESFLKDLQDMLGQGLTALACTLDSLISKKD
ncbi:hypothetical protein ABEB36_000160 [Hypothenemus hampei]|uniref:HAT C-terminal dimerisation domain-containing protein n=1 Tax=Hypothenemus hampei TaxID=57062 RepID=A0ABD1FAD6_HYPHA